ncbi:MAG: glycosyltransferase family 4 protein [Rhodobacter sp.]|nr:glycosyltransferase family 4 protein [Rhodobacter sp.]
MKIVHICPYDMTRPGGVQRHVRDFAAWLNGEGHASRILAPPAPGQRTKPPGEVIEIGTSRAVNVHGTGFEVSWAPTRQRRAWARELHAWGADLIHMHTPWTPLLTWQMWRALRLPTVATVHATLPAADARGPVDRYIRWAARRILPQVQAVVVPSASPQPLLERLIPGLQTVVLPPSVDLAPWRDAAGGRVRQECLHLAFLGRLEPRKGVDILLQAWPRIADALPRARLTIAGDGPMRARVEAAVSDRLRFLPRPEDAAACRLLAETDVFLAPAPYGESFGLVLTEAMSAGALPVAAANSGYASVLTGDGAGLLVPPGDAAALASRVVALARDPQQQAQLGAWARSEARRHDIASTGPRYLDLFETVLAGTPAPAD